MIEFSLNHIAAPRLSCGAFFDLARRIGIGQVEIRNDIECQPIADSTPPAEIGREAKARGIRILTINALQRFNDWNDARAAEARELACAVRDCGAAALVLVPVNDAAFRLSDPERVRGLRAALAGLLPILAEAGIAGFVEPLGFEISSLRYKSEALDAIDAVGGAATFHVVHDTFHHHLAGEARMFPARTGLVHISGVQDAALAIRDMRDPHRVLVGEADRLDNLGQMRALVAGGYGGPFSFEPFAASVQTSADPAAELTGSMEFIRKGLRAAA